MVENVTPDDERHLAERLRREAAAERPAFSDELHRRIVEAVGAAKVQPGSSGRRRLGPRAWLSAALVASLAGAATVAVSRYLDRDEPPGPAPRETAVVPPDPAPLPEAPQPKRLLPPDERPRLDPLDAVAGGTAETVGGLVDATLTRSQWAYLDHDARVAADLVLSQLPLDWELLASEESQP